MMSLFTRKHRFVRVRNEDGAVIAAVSTRALPDDVTERRVRIGNFAKALTEPRGGNSTAPINNRPISVKVQLSGGRSFEALSPGVLGRGLDRSGAE